MTHLKIELNNGIIEEVSSAVIDKLYDIVHSGNLDLTSNLIGRLHTSATYQDYIDYLEDTFKVNGVKLLIIDATKKYIMFADPEVLSYWANSTYGDGTGINSTSAASVLSIPNNAFKGNTSLLDFSDLNTNLYNITSIGTSSFLNCSNLTNIDLSNITSIGSSAFMGCSALTTVGDLSNCTLIDWGVFSGCSSLTGNIDLSNVTTIADFAFQNCSSLTTVGDLSNCTSISRAAFGGCSSLTSVGDLSNCTSIGRAAFLNCSALTSVDSSNCTSINDETFQNCSSLTTVGDLSNVTSIGNNAFNSCLLLTSVGDTSNVTSVGSYTFNNCSSLTSINLSNVTSIGDKAFNGCTLLTSVNLSNVTSLGTYVFNGCTSLGTNLILELNLTNQTKNPEGAFKGTKYKGLILHWPNAISSWRTNYPLWEEMDLEYLDISDTKWPNQANKVSWYGNSNIETCILSPDFNLVDYGFFDERRNFKYLILLNPNVVTLNYHEKIDRIFRYDYSSMLHIYVPDSLVSSYLSDANWSRTGDLTQSFDLSTKILPLSLLPAGVWTTGLASQYLTPAQLATS